MAQNASLSVLIPTKEQHPLLEKCLFSLEKAIDDSIKDSLHNKEDLKEFEVLVLDSSFDIEETRKVIEKTSIENVKLIPVEKWWNYSQLNNYGVQYADGDDLLFLNNDCYVSNQLFLYTPRYDCWYFHDIDIEGYILEYPDKKIQHAGIDLFRGVPNHRAFLSPMERYDTSKILDVDYVPAVTFALCSMKKDTYTQLGGLDNDYCFAYEDVDFCLRAWEEGMKVSILNKSLAVHEGAMSQGFSANPKATQSYNLGVFRRKWTDSRLKPILEKIQECNSKIEKVLH